MTLRAALAAAALFRWRPSRALLGLAVSACGAGTTSVAGDGGALASGCPSASPLGQACGASQDGLACEYGSDPSAGCDVIVRCTAGSWQKASTSAPASCPTPPLAAPCPSSRSGISAGTPCSPEGTVCSYPEGRCACTLPVSGPPMPNPRASWACESPASGCPEPRPRVGSACSSGGQTCDYGSCTVPGGSELRCVSGAWDLAAAACPNAR